MFTGIVTDVGKVRAISRNGDMRLEITTHLAIDDVEIGASICCSGTCLTVVAKGPDWFTVSVSGETQSRTTLGTWTVGTPINLERALKVGDELGGHLVSGHVDGVARVVSVTPEGQSLRLAFAPPPDLTRYIAPKGSVAVDGVSLTVNEIDDTAFAVNIIPHTRAETTLGALKEGDAVNLEIDTVARYVARLLGKD